MKSKTQIEKQLKRKTNPYIVETIIEAKKKEKWNEVASVLSSPRINRVDINLSEIDKQAKEGDIVVVPGKVLSQGELNKKLKVVALFFSEKAKDKILKTKGECLTIIDEIKKNPDAKEIKIIK